MDWNIWFAVCVRVCSNFHVQATFAFAEGQKVYKKYERDDKGENKKTKYYVCCRKKGKEKEPETTYYRLKLKRPRKGGKKEKKEDKEWFNGDDLKKWDEVTIVIVMMLVMKNSENDHRLLLSWSLAHHGGRKMSLRQKRFVVSIITYVSSILSDTLLRMQN